MQIFILFGSHTGYDYTGDHFLGAYSTRERAGEALAQLSQTTQYDDYTIQAAIVDTEGFCKRPEFSYDEYPYN